MRLEHVVIPTVVGMLWLMIRPARDPYRIRARTASRLSEHEWCKLGAVDGVVRYHRKMDWDSQHAYFRRAVELRLEKLAREQDWPKSRDRVTQFKQPGHRGAKA